MSHGGEASLDRAARAHHLCNNCKSFWERATCLNFTFAELSESGQHVPSMPQHLLHSNRQHEISAAAQSGCHFCSIILGCLTGCTGDHKAREHQRTDKPIYISIALLDQEEGAFLMSLFDCEQPRIQSHDQIISDYTLRLRPLDSQTSGSEEPHVYSRSEANTQRATVDGLTSSRAQTSTYSEATANLIKSWVLECQTNHPMCSDNQLYLLQGPSPTPPRPSRLLDLQAFPTPERIRLVDAEKEQRMSYCTLSYSWGLSEPYVLTSLNLPSFQNEIHLSNLPRTFRDAITVARGIGARYLWADALCIMQNGRTSALASTDWLDQAGKMNSIFGNSLLTISASESHDGNQGFIHPRNPLSHTPCRIDLHTKRPFLIEPPCTPHCPVHPFHNAQYHLDTRAWVFQERLLTPRTVHFTRNFVHLECRTEIRCETLTESEIEVRNCHHAGAVVKADYQNFFALYPLSIPGFEIPGLTLDFVTEPFLSIWHLLVRKYSTTNLSRASDLLVALAGLSKPLHEKFQLTWSFGLWREFLAREMLWYLRHGKGEPARERAPSWSWAGIEVKGPQVWYDVGRVTEVVAEVKGLPETTDFTRLDPLMGDEARFAVRLAGLLRSGVPSLPRNQPSSSSLQKRKGIYPHRFCREMPSLYPECPFHPDYRLPDNIRLYSLLVARCADQDLSKEGGKGWNMEIGVVLTPVLECRRRYRRVGYFHHSLWRSIGGDGRRELPSFFEGCRSQEVEIL